MLIVHIRTLLSKPAEAGFAPSPRFCAKKSEIGGSVNGMVAYHGYDLIRGEISMVKLTIIDVIMITVAVVFILPQLYINPEDSSQLYKGVYAFTCAILSALVGVVINQLLSRRRIK